MVGIVRDLMHKYRYYRYPHYRKEYILKSKKSELRSKKRYTAGEWAIFDQPLKYVDSASCLFIYQEIFENEIYKFGTENKSPFIIDAGANIGLSIIYFKSLFPWSRILAFEPDENVFQVLAENVKNFGLENIQLERKALWNEETTLTFFKEGADAGRIQLAESNKQKTVEVSTVRLRKYLKDQEIDFLKMDIEGAEWIVLKDSFDLLQNVKRIFVEYHSFSGHEQMLPELIKLLKDAGFRLYISSPGVHSKSPFYKIETYEGMDMQLNIYGIRG